MGRFFLEILNDLARSSSSISNFFWAIFFKLKDSFRFFPDRNGLNDHPKFDDDGSETESK